MGIPVPVHAVHQILKEQEKWKTDRETLNEGIHTFTVIAIMYFFGIGIITISKHRNLQKRARKTRHEREKVFMEQLRGLGHATGEYVGGKKADMEQEELRSTLHVINTELK